MTGPVESSLEAASVRTVVAEPQRAAASSRRALVLVVCGIVAVAIVAGWRWSITTGLKRAEFAVDRGDWEAAREHLTAYLAWYPADSTAHMLMAEVLVKGDEGESGEFIPQAIHHLQLVEADSPLAATARLQEARLSLLILQQPSRAEMLLRESLRLDPDAYDANLLMWKLLDLTGRHIISGEFFWRVYELSPESERALRLRDWFFAEFYPETANESFHLAIGATRIGDIPASLDLLVKFSESDPAATSVHAALAAYYLERGRPKSSLELLKAAPDMERAMEDPFYVSVLFEALVDLGEFPKATTCFEQFPEPRDGYLFSRSEGIYRQHVLGDAEGAARAYRAALSNWSAKFDWSLMTRLSECLRKMGQVDEAEKMQSRIKYLTTKVLTIANTSGLRDRLSNLRDPVVAGEVRDLYREFGLTREADAWEEHRLKLARVSQYPLR